MNARYLCALAFFGLAALAVAPASPARAQDHVVVGASAEDVSQLDAFLRARVPAYAPIADEADRFRLQLLVGELLISDTAGEFLVQHGVRPDAEYIYPGTTIHLLAALATVSYVRGLGPGCAAASLDAIELDYHYAPQPGEELTLPGGAVRRLDVERTLGGLLESALRGGAPEAFNRLYDLTGRDELNRFAWSSGLRSVRVQHRTLRGPETIDNADAPRVDVRCTSDGVVEEHVAPARRSLAEIAPSGQERLDVGLAYRDEDDRRVASPMGFAHKNAISMRDQQRLFLALLRPEASAFSLGLSDADRQILLDALNVNEERSGDRPDLARVGTLSIGVERSLRYAANAEVYALTARAYGFITETTAFYLPSADKIVLVSGALYTNANGVLNDDRYEYGDVTVPLFRAIGQRVADYFRDRYREIDTVRNPSHL